MKNKIHISESTAMILIESGKEHWIQPRLDPVHAKGKGILKTFWLNPHASQTSGKSGETSQTESVNEDIQNNAVALSMQKADDSKNQERRIDWVCDVLLELIQKVAHSSHEKSKTMTSDSLILQSEPSKTPMDELMEEITFQKGMDLASVGNTVKKECTLPANVRSELRDYITSIAATYQSNPFHNFEHACHVTMSVKKLLSRIKTPNISTDSVQGDYQSRIHAYTSGIISDPLAQLAIVFAALIHDVDHRGKLHFTPCYVASPSLLN
jgi:3'5'-cyclic nucleotide phosphodiesterase